MSAWSRKLLADAATFTLSGSAPMKSASNLKVEVKKIGSALCALTSRSASSAGSWRSS
jgi:hypothetical protein